MESTTLKGRIIFVSGIITLTVVLALSVANNLTRQEQESYHNDRTVKSKFVLWHKIVNEQISKMEAELFALTRNANALGALASKNSGALKDAVKPMFNRLSATNVISAMQITDDNGTILYADNDSAGGKTSNHLVFEALREGKLKRGIVRNNGQVFTAFVFPIYSKPGKAIGSGILLNHLQPAVNDFKHNDNAEVFVLDSKGKAEYQTHESLLSTIKYVLPEPGASSLSVAHADNKIYSVTIHPIDDGEQSVSGYVVSMNDFTENYNRLQAIETTSWVSIALIVLTALGVLYWFMQRSMRPLDTVIDVMKKIADGDLSNEVNVTSSDEIGQLLKAAKDMQAKLRDIVGNMVQVASDLDSGSVTLTEITNETRNGATRQASETDLVATAMTEMASTVHEVATNAGLAADAANKADHESKNGQLVVNNTIAVINELATEVENVAEVIHKLEHESNAISSVLDVIKGIAEQTNLLALNAAIEAARAGEQGRGFAVVADEVRTLATRTQQSTAEIHDMIEKLQIGSHEAVQVMQKGRERAKTSVEQAELSGQSLMAITETVAIISDMNTQIAAAAEEQSAVATEINRNVVNISQIAEDSSRGAEETGHASQNMAGLSAKMQQLIKQFSI